MDTLLKIVAELNELFDSMPKGPGAFDEGRWLRERMAVIRKHGYTDTAFRRALNRLSARQLRGRPEDG